MRAENSPFRCRWQSFSLENAGLAEFRPRQGTYAGYDYERLPELPFALSGGWEWLLTGGRSQGSHGIGQGRWERNSASLRSLSAAVAVAGLVLPRSFTHFFSEPGLAERIRSNTGCYLDLADRPRPWPVGGGFLIRFLNDSQGCLFWYLYLAPDGDHAVVSSFDFYGAPEEEEGFYEDLPEEGRPSVQSPDRIFFAAETFEAFMGRFWLENEIWFAGHENREMLPAGVAYLKAYCQHK